MKAACLLFILFLSLSFPCLLAAQDTFILKGYLKDAESGEALMGVSVLLLDKQKGVSTDERGYYELQLKAGTYQLRYSYIGYTELLISLELRENRQLDVALTAESIQAGEISVSGKRAEENVLRHTDQISLSKKEMETLPYLLGQVDPLKSLQLLPGVQSNGEGNNGLFVRGGAIDQNLILFDQAPIYNTGHLFGFFSLFNHSVIEQVNLIKGGIPASYGGRLSSILEIQSRKGNFKKWKGEGLLGVVSGSFTLEGPIAKDKSAFIISGRRTYIDLVSKMLGMEPGIFGTGIDYFFDDLNARIDVKLSERDQLALSAFTGTDDFHFEGKNSLSNSIRWKNHTASLQYEHFFNQDDYLKTTFYASSYKMNFRAGINTYVFNIHSSIEDLGAKGEWVIASHEKHKITFGAEYIKHGLVPNNMKAKGEDVEFSFAEQEELHSQEEALFIHDEFQLAENLSLNGGLRLNAYQQLGPFTRYVSDASMTLQDTLVYGKGKIIRHYWNLAPRLSMVYRLGEQTSLKGAYDRTYQYLHMAPVSSVSLPTDVWVPSSDKIKPQQGDQISLGYFRNFQDNSLEASFTAYYKSMRNQLEYRDGVIVGYSKGFNYDDSFIFGRGHSYGLEMFLRKNKGDLKGWISYTLSRTRRSFSEINGGKSFAAKYDRLHNLSWVNNYELNQRWTLSGVFTYASGNALTLPIGRYIINGNIINEYEGRNTFRMPPYHRMDVSATYKGKKKKHFQSFWIFSVYNLYNRQNPYYIYFETKGNVNDYYLEVSLEKVSLFPIIPSVAWQFQF